ncbi:MAG: formyltransferase family protein [Pseudomonadota bacterium]
MRICLITYDTSHSKTADVFFGLYHRHRFELEFLLVPFKQRAVRETLVQHRPDMFVGPSARQLAARYDIPIREYEEREKALAADYLLICGANLLEPAFVESGKIINCHPGLIPLARGLDSFKWAIYFGRKMGNTLHIIDEEADSGEVIAHLETPLFSTDTLEDFAERHYKSELWMLQNFDHFLSNRRVESLPKEDASRRMPMETEKEMVDRFSDYRDKYAV